MLLRPREQGDLSLGNQREHGVGKGWQELWEGENECTEEQAGARLQRVK